MKKLFGVIALGSVSLLSANQPYGYSQSYGQRACANGNCGYQHNDYSYQGYQGPYQGQGQGYQQDQYQRQYQDAGSYESPYQNHGYQESPRYQRQMERPVQSQGGYYQQNDQRFQDNSPNQYQRQEPVRVYPDAQWNNQSQRVDSRGNDRVRYEDNRRNADQVGDLRVGADQDIIKKVQDTVAPGMFSRGYPNVSFDVSNAVVTLKGSVDSQDDKVKIEDSVKKIKGVRQVNNQLTVVGKQVAYNDGAYSKSETTYGNNDNPKMRDAQKNYPQDVGFTEADKLLNAKVREKISDGWFTNSFETITLKTNNGVVTIIGVVDSSDDIRKINDKLKDVDGVKAVNNQLSLKK